MFTRQILVSPVSRKSPWISFGFEKVRLERNADNSGREFWAWIFWVAWCPGKTRPKNSPSKFAEKFAGNFPTIRQTKIKNSPPIPLCITSGPTNLPEFEVGNGKNYQKECPKKSFWFLSQSFRGETWHCSADTQGPLSANLPELPIRNSEELKSATVKITYIPKKAPLFFSRSVKILVRIGRTPRGSCNRTLLRRVLRRFSNSKCFLEGFLEGAL